MIERFLSAMLEQHGGLDRKVSCRVACLFPLFVIVLSFTSLPNIAIHKIGPEATYKLGSEVVFINVTDNFIPPGNSLANSF